ncbi:MAG: Fur family transcriptional regulator [Pontibacterium sp.]
MSLTHFGFDANHDHAHCESAALADAKALCQSRGLRLTPIREHVLTLIWQSHKPLGAYEILPQLAEAGFNSAPPTVYRALEFLQEQGFVHRIASLNAFIGCPSPDHQHSGYFLICRSCQNAVEMNGADAEAFIHHQANALGFQVETVATEVSGLCPNCSQAQEAKS